MKALLTAMTLALGLTVLNAHAATNIASAFSDVTPTYSQCFTRSYDATHMSRNRLQTVERIKVKLKRASLDKNSRETYPILAIQVKRKGERGVWTNNIMCNDSENGTVVCGVECDGGSVEILSRDANGLMVLKNNGVVLHGGCGSDDETKTIWLDNKRGGDDVFRLLQDRPAACADVSNKTN